MEKMDNEGKRIRKKLMTEEFLYPDDESDESSSSDVISASDSLNKLIESENLARNEVTMESVIGVSTTLESQEPATNSKIELIMRYY